MRSCQADPKSCRCCSFPLPLMLLLLLLPPRLPLLLLLLLLRRTC
jgi:hypothetical protein